MSYGSKPDNHQCETVRTISAVITAACLLIMTIGFLVAGTWTVRTLHTLQTDYHPEKLRSMLDAVSDTLDSVHQSTYLLKSGKHVPIMDDIHRLLTSLEQLSTVMSDLPIEKMVSESSSWRLMATHLLSGVKNTLTR